MSHFRRFAYVLLPSYATIVPVFLLTECGFDSANKFRRTYGESLTIRLDFHEIRQSWETLGIIVRDFRLFKEGIA